MGYTGQGMVVAGNDTGLYYQHPALIRQYRGCQDPPTCSVIDHNFNWWDATGLYPTVPDDGHGHGTHTTGTMVGDDGAGNQIGMAPGAQHRPLQEYDRRWWWRGRLVSYLLPVGSSSMGSKWE